MSRRQRSRSRRRGRERSRIALGATLIALALVLFGGGALWWVEARRAYVVLDPVTLCPKDGPRATTVLLLDRTDPLTAIQTAALRGKIEGIVDAVPRYGRLEIYTVGPIADRPLEPLYARCNPGRSEDIDPTIGNPRLIEKKWLEGFRAPLEQVFDELLRSSEAPVSPIMESIQSVSVTAFLTVGSSDKQRRLVIVSDMLQHTEGYSQYKSRERFEAFRERPYYRHVHADLRGVEVEILYLRRDAQRKYGVEGHIDFWERYFSDQGARVEQISSLPG